MSDCGRIGVLKLIRSNIMQITEEYFYKATGRQPKEDDMERVNCPKAGESGHNNCGWNYVYNCPAYERTTSLEERKVR